MQLLTEATARYVFAIAVGAALVSGGSSVAYADAMAPNAQSSTTVLQLVSLALENDESSAVGINGQNLSVDEFKNYLTDQVHGTNDSVSAIEANKTTSSQDGHTTDEFTFATGGVDTSVGLDGQMIFNYELGQREDMNAVVDYSHYYIIHFVGIDGTLIQNVSVKAGDSVSAPQAPEVKGFEFTGWDRPLDAINDEETILAVYQPIEEVPIIEPRNGGTISTSFVDDVTPQLDKDPQAVIPVENSASAVSFRNTVNAPVVVASTKEVAGDLFKEPVKKSVMLNSVLKTGTEEKVEQVVFEGRVTENNTLKAASAKSHTHAGVSLAIGLVMLFAGGIFVIRKHS